MKTPDGRASEQMELVATWPSLTPATLIIPTRNRPDLLLSTVESVLEGDEVPSELIIVDQSDQAHPTLPTLRSTRCQIHYVWSQSRGVSQARNEGIDAAQHDILVFIDDDVLVARTWFGTIVRALIDAGRWSVVTGQVLMTGGGTPAGFAPSLQVEDRPATYTGRVSKDVLYSNNMAMYRSAIEDIGLFDTRLGAGALFPAATDNDCGFLLLEAGYRIVYVPIATVYHRAWRSEEDFLPLRWNYGVGRGAFYAKHVSLHDRHMLGRLSRDIAAHTVPAVRGVWRNPRRAAGDAALALGLIYGASKWLLTQPRPQ